MHSTDWQRAIKYDALKALLESNNKAIAFFAQKDLLGQTKDDITILWDMPQAKKIIKKQQSNGSWKYPGGNTKIRTAENYDQIETFRNLGYLVEMYGLNKQHPAVTKAAEFLFGFQTKAGDIRGILGNQYMPYYMAAILELLIKSGYTNDQRINKAFGWLNSMRQNDGGWAIPLRTCGKKLDIIAMNSPTLEPDRSKLFSHLVTGMVLRAYAAHPTYSGSIEAKKASKLLLASLFKKDNYPDRSGPEYWLRFTYPFWFTDLISAMDSLSRLGFKDDEPQIKNAADWFVGRQDPSGLWVLKTLKNQKKFNTDLWISLSICRILKRLYS